MDPARERRFVLALALGAGLLALLPTLLAYFATPSGSVYLGHQTNTDDHMVYAAWMRQAMDGRLLMDNRFTTDLQPGLTVHLYFFALGLIAKVTGIPAAMTLARLVFNVLFVLLAHRLVRRAAPEASPLASVLVVFGGGLGFLVWHTFGQAIVRPAPAFLSGPMLGRLPVDVWQPEGFVFPSMLTNGLFMVSVCLIVFVFLSFLRARDSWHPVLPGALAFGLLMNIHSYDALLIALVMVGFLAMTLVRKQATPAWVGRSVVIAAGALPPALWFLHVIRNDPVFASRAATETYSPNFRQVLFGYAPLVLLALVGLGLRARTDERRTPRLVGLGLVVALFVGMFVAAAGHAQGYFMSRAAWAGVFVVAIAAVALLAEEEPAWNLLVTWAVVGTVALYFPTLFQRKLAMGLAVPWAVLAAAGLAVMLQRQEASTKRLVTALAVIVLGASSARWIGREIELSRMDVSTTTVHPVYLPEDAVRIVAFLNAQAGRKVVVAPPGVPSTAIDPLTQKPIPDGFLTPVMPDLNPILSGLTGSYTYAGHWSETPRYNEEKRGMLQRLYFTQRPPEEQRGMLRQTGAEYVVAPVPTAFPGLPLTDLGGLGEVVVDGKRFRLLRLH